MEENILNKISIEELKKYKGSICLYSTNLEDNLGDVVKEQFKELFSDNNVSYNISLSTKTDSSLILIDGDDFNPSKVGGLIKSYSVPIVIFVGNETKLSKLKDVLLKEPLILSKSDCKEIDIKENVLKNIEEKRKRDEQKRLLENSDENSSISSEVVENKPSTEIIDNKKENIPSKTFFFTDDIEENNTKNEDKEPEKIDESINNNQKTLNISSSTTFFFDDFEDEKAEDKNEENEVDNKEVLDTKGPEIEKVPEKEVEQKEEPKESFFEENDLVKKIDFSEEKRAFDREKKLREKQKNEKFFFYKNKKLEKIGCYTNDLAIINIMNDIFGPTESIDCLDDKTKYDIVIIDITFALPSRVFDCLKYQNCPAIIISKRSSKLHEFKENNVADVLYIEKPITVGKEIIIEDFRDYLNHFDYVKNSKVQLNKPTISNFGSTMDVDKKGSRAYRKPSIDMVKKEINRTNKRADKEVSLEDIYQKMGLNDISVFNSKINTAIFICEDNVVVKYTPAGYLIEYRIKRLESQGIPKEQINIMMKEFEDSDIRFQKRILQNIEDKQKKANL